MGRHSHAMPVGEGPRGRFPRLTSTHVRTRAMPCVNNRARRIGMKKDVQNFELVLRAFRTSTGVRKLTRCARLHALPSLHGESRRDSSFRGRKSKQLSPEIVRPGSLHVSSRSYPIVLVSSTGQFEKNRSLGRGRKRRVDPAPENELAARNGQGNGGTEPPQVRGEVWHGRLIYMGRRCLPLDP